MQNIVANLAPKAKVFDGHSHQSINYVFPSGLRVLFHIYQPFWRSLRSALKIYLVHFGMSDEFLKFMENAYSRGGGGFWSGHTEVILKNAIHELNRLSDGGQEFVFHWNVLMILSFLILIFIKEARICLNVYIYTSTSMYFYTIQKTQQTQPSSIEWMLIRLVFDKLQP